MLSDPSRSGEDGKYDPFTVLGLKRTDTVLVLGNPAFLPWLTYEHDQVVEARRAADAEKLIREGHRFDRVIIGRETQFSNDHILRAGALLERNTHGNGLLVYFPKDDGEAWQFKESLEFYYPNCRTWEHRSSFGDIITAEPFGASWRLIAA